MCVEIVWNSVSEITTVAHVPGSCLFETLLTNKQWRYWMNWKKRWGLSFILHWDAPSIAVNFAYLEFRLSRQWPLFTFFCSNILSCNRPRTMLALKQKSILPSENVCMDSQICSRLQKNAEQHRNVGSQKYVQTHFIVCLNIPCGTGSEGFLGLCRHCFDTTEQKSWVCCLCLCVCMY